MTRRLLIRGGGAVISPAPTPPPGDPPTTEIVTLTTAPDGGNNPWNIWGAWYVGGDVVYAWVAGNGNLEWQAWTEATHVNSGPHTLTAGFEVDAHDSPALLPRSSDGRWIIYYTRHNVGNMWVRLSTTTHPIDGVASPTDLDSQLGGTRYTDPQMHEVNGLLYLFYRDEPSAGTDSRWCISTTLPSTPTSGWAAQTIVYRVASTRSYVISTCDTVTGYIHFIATNGGATVGGISGFSRLGHFYLNTATGTYHKSDGTTITLPLSYSSITEIYAGTLGVFPSNVVIDSVTGDICVAAEDTFGGSPNYIYVRFNGSTWSHSTVVSCGTGYEYSGTGTGFGSWGQTLDQGNPNIYWLLRDTGGNPGIWRYETADDGATWTGELLEAGTGEQTQVISVRNPHDLRAFWQSGGTGWTTYTNWNMGLKGVIDSGTVGGGGGGGGGGSSDPAFLTRPFSAPLTFNGGTSVTVSNVSIYDTSPLYTNVGIYLYNVHGTITIQDVDLADLVGGILLDHCSGTLLIDNVRSRNIGDNTIGSGHSNHIQMGNCVFDGSIQNCKFLGGHTEDMVSIFESGGSGAGHELYIQNNHWQSPTTDQSSPTVRAWTSASGTGIIVGDGAGSPNNGHVIVVNNTFLTPGQIGIALIDGPAIHVYNNIIYGQKRSGNNVPLGADFGNPIAEVDHNTYYWTNNDNSHPGFYYGSGTINDHDNTQDPTLNPNDYVVSL